MGKVGFGLGFLGHGGKFGDCGKFGDNGGSSWDKTESASNDPVDSTVLSGTIDVLIFSFPFIIREEVLIGDSADIGVTRESDRGMNEVGFMPFGVDKKGTEEFLQLIQRFSDREGPFNPVDHRVDFFKPRKP